MKAIVILAGIFAVVAVAQAYPSNMLDTFLQALDLPAELEQAPIMEIQEYNEKSYEEVCACMYNYTIIIEDLLKLIYMHVCYILVAIFKKPIYTHACSHNLYGHNCYNKSSDPYIYGSCSGFDLILS